MSYIWEATNGIVVDTECLRRPSERYGVFLNPNGADSWDGFIAMTRSHQLMTKTYRRKAVAEAVKQWARSEWFTAGELLDLASQLNTQPRGGLTVFSVSRILTGFEAKGMVESRRKLGKKIYRRTKNGCGHLHE